MNATLLSNRLDPGIEARDYESISKIVDGRLFCLSILLSPSLQSS